MEKPLVRIAPTSRTQIIAVLAAALLLFVIEQIALACLLSLSD